MLRSSMPNARALSAPPITCSRSPCRVPNSSSRSSATATRSPFSSASHSDASRSTVVLPQPGGPSSSTRRAKSPGPSRYGLTAPLAPGTSWLMRMHTELTPLIRHVPPSCVIRPHTPARWPPAIGIYPCAIWPSQL